MLLAVGTVVAGWNWAHGTHHLICSPPEDGEYASYVLDTALLVVAVKGGTASFSLPRAGGPPTFSPQGALAALQGLPVQWVAVKLNTASLAGGAAGSTFCSRPTPGAERRTVCWSSKEITVQDIV